MSRKPEGGLDHGIGHPVFLGLWSTRGDERQCI
jgi:hypothetical protein